MRTLCTGAYIAVAFLVVARATQTVIVDDGDPGIEYRGSWVHNPVEDPKDFNYGGSVTFTNVSGSIATYKFAGIAIAVFGGFEEAGTFAMHSTYSIDGGTAADFIPASTIVRASYRQKFFQSNTLPDGEHTLVITNAGKELWFDYLLVTQESQSTTTTATTAASQKPQELPSGTAQSSPPGLPTTPSPSPTSADRPSTAQSLSAPSSQAQTTQPFSSTNNVTHTSTDDAASAPSPTCGTPQSQTSTFVSDIPSSTQTRAPERAHSAKMTAGGVAGLAVAGLLVVILIAMVGWRSRRRRQTKRSDLAPYDPGLTALAFEPSEKHELAREDGSRCSRAISLLSLPHGAPAQQAPVDIRASGSSVGRSVLHEIRTTSLSGTTSGETRLAGFEPLGSLSAASPLLARHSRGMRQHKWSPVSLNTNLSRYLSPLDERRRSVDGGVRIAGGPPGSLRQAYPLDEADDVRSGLSTLPPSYQLYPGS